MGKRTTKIPHGAGFDWKELGGFTLLPVVVLGGGQDFYGGDGPPAEEKRL